MSTCTATLALGVQLHLFARFSVSALDYQKPIPCISYVHGVPSPILIQLHCARESAILMLNSAVCFDYCRFRHPTRGPITVKVCARRDTIPTNEHAFKYMGFDEQERFYSPEHRDRKEIIQEINEVIQLKSFLRKERQISEIRLKAIEERDQIIARFSAANPSREVDVDLLERRLASEIAARTEITTQAQGYVNQIAGCKAALERLLARTEDLIGKEVWQATQRLERRGSDELSDCYHRIHAAFDLLSDRMDTLVDQRTQRWQEELNTSFRANAKLERQLRVYEVESQQRVALLEHMLQEKEAALSAQQTESATNAASLQQTLEDARNRMASDEEQIRMLNTQLDEAISKQNALEMQLASLAGELASQTKTEHQQCVSHESSPRGLFRTRSDARDSFATIASTSAKPLRNKRQQSPEETTVETVASETKGEGTSPESVVTEPRQKQKGTISSDDKTGRAKSPPRRRTRRAAI
eukprot:Protomagalhaensia_wolfi_Nauph_80__2408@NODE_258_length_3038_cov_45_745248_g193_i0_p1_GENE_NODE_258_length_3038_cov_45_745248_g193_i0NODE_258_length_3038_cov_45_745248_g193_i0_p1_ORF_typecomplete_len472_score52_32PIN7/PF18475_1/0_18Filament/PF00038_21/3_9Filament/PF00038_21/0_32Peptidase_S28/PF05577_12/0_28DUF3584/PF12128_8/1_6Laminin_II/PF06009_12/1_6e03Laminin_II/PF06009_12/2Bacillus_HBL/PF05791_11/4_1e03Bacillus_HBL/PF05791_11/0_78Vmethyltransf_C/PF08456_10/22Vmethyltransf_C/PF08456_10/16DUF80